MHKSVKIDDFTGRSCWYLHICRHRGLPPTEYILAKKLTTTPPPPYPSPSARPQPSHLLPLQAPARHGPPPLPFPSPSGQIWRREGGGNRLYHRLELCHHRRVGGGKNCGWGGVCHRPPLAPAGFGRREGVATAIASPTPSIRSRRRGGRKPRRWWGGAPQSPPSPPSVGSRRRRELPPPPPSPSLAGCGREGGSRTGMERCHHRGICHCYRRRDRGKERWEEGPSGREGRRGRREELKERDLGNFD